MAERDEAEAEAKAMQAFYELILDACLRIGPKAAHGEPITDSSDLAMVSAACGIFVWFTKHLPDVLRVAMASRWEELVQARKKGTVQ